MTEREVSSERDDSAFLRGMALAYATDDNEHSQKGAARLREIADNILALRSSVKTETPAAASEVTEDWIRDTAMNVMLATEVEEAVRLLTAALKGDRP